MKASKPDIQTRTFGFAVRIIARQIARSGTGIGANIEEAQASHSKADFARRMNIARGEARETLYWLRLIAEAKLLPRNRLNGLIAEAEEIVRILVAIVKTSKRVTRGSSLATRSS